VFHRILPAMRNRLAILTNVRCLREKIRGIANPRVVRLASIGSANAACGAICGYPYGKGPNDDTNRQLAGCFRNEIIVGVHSAVVLRIAGARFSQDSHDHLLHVRK
jgi:hypothetical protein